jgi:hypothetical protein
VHAVPFRAIGTAAPVKPGPGQFASELTFANPRPWPIALVLTSLCVRVLFADNYMRGRQLAEFEREHELEGVAGFNDQPAEGDFGTMAKPVRIYSAFHSRIVGCKGGDHNQHRMFWFELKEGPKHVCTECGQAFKLVTPTSTGSTPAAPKPAAH